VVLNEPFDRDRHDMMTAGNFESAALSNLVLEQGLLGAILNSSGVFDVIEPHVLAEDFAESLHAQLFETIAATRESGGLVTLPLVIAAMGGYGAGLIAEGMSARQYAARLAAEAVTIREAVAYAKQIREFANRRKILAVAEMMLGGVHGTQSSVETAGAGIELLDEIAGKAAAGSTPQITLREANQQSLARMQFGMQNPGKLSGISWGLVGLDSKTGGLKRGEMSVMAGRPGMGKTALALCVAKATSAAGEPTLFFSLEMGGVSLSDRQLADVAFDHRNKIPYYDIANGTVSDAQAQRLIDAARVQRDWPLTIDPAPGLTVSQIIARTRKHKQMLERQGKRLGPVIVDHMHIVRPSNRYSGARVNEVGEISAALKGLAKDLDVPVIALAQLSRAVENREDKRPSMADLRDSGTIEQDADTIIFVYREAYYLERETAPNQEREAARIDRLLDSKDQLEAIVAKQRNGPTGTVKLFCDIACNAVRDLGVA
jgi:replicative DNA helicase